ncbi:hypothetical protein HPB47_021429 [Ixodes persulcatus]|uniref:Uncharacterized protein n=1 Tax=Ixodes persulcatus TaxID=34615 RepID=A0AC60QCK6_IXOPE|nr:hypothetical protein HPB47_021429 [Ixodes persulcatus]
MLIANTIKLVVRKQTLPLLRASIPGRRPAATGNKVHKLGDVRLPKQVEQVLSHGPKFAVEQEKVAPRVVVSVEVGLSRSLPDEYSATPPKEARVSATELDRQGAHSVDNTDENGTRITQEETGDENNVKTGSYSYTDPFGMQRTVKYVADATGFHVTIETNEPGTKTSNPADAQIISSSVEAPAPAPVVVKPAPVVVKTVQQAPVTVHAVHASPVVHAIQAPISYAAPITYDTAHHVTPITVSLSHAPLTYSLGAAKSA